MILWLRTIQRLLRQPSGTPTLQIGVTDAGSPAWAYVRATKAASELYFCRHHYNDHQAQLITQGFEIEDRTDILDDECAKYKAVSDDNF